MRWVSIDGNARKASHSRQTAFVLAASLVGCNGNLGWERQEPRSGTVTLLVLDSRGRMADAAAVRSFVPNAASGPPSRDESSGAIAMGTIFSGVTAKGIAPGSYRVSVANARFGGRSASCTDTELVILDSPLPQAAVVLCREADSHSPRQFIVRLAESERPVLWAKLTSLTNGESAFATPDGGELSFMLTSAGPMLLHLFGEEGSLETVILDAPLNSGRSGPGGLVKFDLGSGPISLPNRP